MNKKVIIWIIAIAIVLVLIFGLPGGKKEDEKSGSQGKDSTAQTPGTQTGTGGKSTPESTETAGAVIDDALLEISGTQESDDSVVLSDEAVISEPTE